MIAESRINRSKFEITLISNIMNLFGDLFFLKTSMRSECTSHLHHDFALSFFDYKEWVNLGQKIIKTLTSDLRIKNSSFFFRNSGFSFLLVICCFGYFFKPFHKIFISVTNLDIGMIIEKIMGCFGPKKTDKKTSFSINDSRKISQFRFSHKTSFINDYTVYNKPYLFVQPERLNPWDTLCVCDSLNSTYKKRLRGNVEELPRLYNIGHKSNRLPVLNSAAARLGQAMRETQDVVMRDTLESSASVVNSVGGVNNDLPTEMSLSDADDIVTLLQNNSAEYITNMIPGALKIDTSPIGDAYGCMLTTRMIPVLNNLQGFVRKFQYPNVSETLQSEWGGVNNIRFFVSEQGSVTPNASLNGNDVANCFVAAKEAYKVVWQAGGKAKFIYLPPGYNNDPCMLRHTAGCSFYQGQCITNDLWIQNLRSTGI